MRSIPRASLSSVLACDSQSTGKRDPRPPLTYHDSLAWTPMWLVLQERFSSSLQGRSSGWRALSAIVCSICCPHTRLSLARPANSAHASGEEIEAVTQEQGWRREAGKVSGTPFDADARTIASFTQAGCTVLHRWNPRPGPRVLVRRAAVCNLLSASDDSRQVC